MRQPSVIVVLLSGLLLVACNSLQPRPTATPTSFTATSSPTATNTSTPTLSPTLTPTLTPTPTPKPTKTLLPTKPPAPPTSTPNALGFILPTGEPVSEWKGIPIMPGAITGEELKEGDASYAFTIEEDIVTVRDYYVQELPKKGWTLLTVGEGPTGNVLAIFTKGSEVLSVAIVATDQEGKLVLVLLVLS